MNAILTYARTQIRAFFRDPVALFFVIALPLIFLAVFGSIIGNTATNFRVAVIDGSGTSFAQQLLAAPEVEDLITVTDVESLDDAKEQMSRGQIDSIIDLPPGFGDVAPVGDVQAPAGQMTVFYSESSPQAGQAGWAAPSSPTPGRGTATSSHDAEDRPQRAALTCPGRQDKRHRAEAGRASRRSPKERVRWPR